MCRSLGKECIGIQSVVFLNTSASTGGEPLFFKFWKLWNCVLCRDDVEGSPLHKTKYIGESYELMSSCVLPGEE